MTENGVRRRSPVSSSERKASLDMFGLGPALLCLALALAPALAGAEGEPSTYGSEMPEAGTVLPLGEVLSDSEERVGKTAKFSGLATKVCQRKGCWMILADGEHFARVTFKDYGFFVPTDLAPRRCIVYGVLEASVLSEGRARHFAEDEGLDAEAIKGPQREYSIVASSVSCPHEAPPPG